MKLSKQKIQKLMTFYKSDYVLLTLTLIEWVDKTSGEAKACYAFSANSSVSTKLPHGISGRVDTGESYSAEGRLTLWLPDMTPEMFTLYGEEDLDTMYYHLPTNEMLATSDVTTEQLSKAPQVSAPTF